MNVTIDHLIDAGFVQLTKPGEDPIISAFVPTFFHGSILTMPETEQADQPHIQCRLSGNPMAQLLGTDDSARMEGRYGAITYPIRILNELHLFMRNFGYTYPIQSQPTLLP